VARKLVVFVPPDALDAVRDALFAAGTEPSVGEAGREERVPELRLETVYPADRHDDVVAALRCAHPYEEPAFDVYELVE